MRPDSTRWFGAGYLLWMLAAISWESWVTFGFVTGRQRDSGWVLSLLIGGLIVAHLALNLALRHYIVARPKRVARTIFTGLMGAGWAFFCYLTVQYYLRFSGVPITSNMGFMMLSLAAQLGLLRLLFRPDAGAWLRGETPESAEALEQTFR